jgi:hypothetical protein
MELTFEQAWILREQHSMRCGSAPCGVVRASVSVVCVPVV